MDDNKFNKEYKYNIRHSYGLEGKRANYSAKRSFPDFLIPTTNLSTYSCIQLLAPGSSDHGCPYRNYDPENLPTTLQSLFRLRSSDIPEIITTVKAKHYHVACTRVFELTHASYGVSKGDGIGGGESVTHPNQYAARSMELSKAKESMVLE